MLGGKSDVPYLLLCSVISSCSGNRSFVADTRSIYLCSNSPPSCAVVTRYCITLTVSERGRMPHKEDSSVSIIELHPTFAAELHGVDVSQALSPALFVQIHDAITKVSECSLRPSTATGSELETVRRSQVSEHWTRRCWACCLRWDVWGARRCHTIYECRQETPSGL